jgi:hypothetical protein
MRAGWSAGLWRGKGGYSGPCEAPTLLSTVIPGLGPGIHDFASGVLKSWMPGPSPGMTHWRGAARVESNWHPSTLPRPCNPAMRLTTLSR